MNSKDFEKQKREIWARYEGELKITVPNRLRRYIENEVNEPDEDDLEGLECSIPSYIRACTIYADWVRNSTQNSPQNKLEDSNPKRVYRKPFEKRIYLVEFVVEKVLTFHNLINRSFTPHKRIGWKKLTEVWNKKHPYNIITPEWLRTEFYRIIRDASMQHEFFDRRDKEFAEFATEGFRKEATVFAEAMHEASRANGVDFDFTQGEGIEIRWLNKQMGEPPTDKMKLDYMSRLIHNAIETAKTNLPRGEGI